MRRLIPDTFIVLLLATVLLASILPARGGAATAAGWLATAAIMVLFFFHGAKLSREAVLQGLRHWRLHLLILAVTFLFFPLLALALSGLLRGFLLPPLWTGVLFLAALPATVQSAIAFTSIARGNVAAAVASASASQVLGIFLTPPLVALLTSSRDAPVAVSGIGAILLQLLAPFLAGHLLRPWVSGWMHRHRAAIAVSDRGAVLLSVYSAFSVAVVEGIWHKLPWHQLAALTVVCAAMLALALVVTRGLAGLCGFDRADRITIVFCGTKKSLIQGVPMARVLFPGPDVGIILLPIMLFHQMQLMACAWIAARYAREGQVGS